MPGGLGNALHKNRKKKADQARAKYREAVQKANENAEHSMPVARDDDYYGRDEFKFDEPSAKNLTSIWQTSNMDDFLAIASERETGFAAERNVRVVVDGTTHVVNDDKIQPLSDPNKDWFALSDNLKIPTRPPWTFDMTADQIQMNEKKMFLDWRRGLAQVEENEKITMTPYEKNLEVWRQLWRVVERSDIVLELVDARNPLAFRSQHFEQYVTEHKNTKKVVKKVILLLNKADLLTEEQRKLWAEYFDSRNFTYFFFSAQENLEEQEALKAKLQAQGEGALEAYAKKQELEAAKFHGYDYSDDSSDDNDIGVTEEEAIRRATKPAPKPEPKKKRRNKKSLRGNASVLENNYEMYSGQRVLSQQQKDAEEKHKAEVEAYKKMKAQVTAEELERDARLNAERMADHKPWDVLSPEALLDHLAFMRQEMKVTARDTPLMVGLVGYPNVGKSSTINAIIGSKKVVVSSTPGKTKHFQTLQIPNERRVMLCDCPGLVFPSFAATKNTMICDGVLPIDTVKDYVTPIGLICQRIPQIVFERMYKIRIHKSLDVDDSTNDADLMLNLVARRKNYMTDHDKPYRAKAAKEILKMYVDGGLVYVHPPPGYEASDDIKNMYLDQMSEDEEEEAEWQRKVRTKPHYERDHPEYNPEDDEDIVALDPAADIDSDEWVTDDSNEDEDEDDWEDVDSASDARGISDDELDMDNIRYAGTRKPKKVIEDDMLKPRTFLTRPSMEASHIDGDQEYLHKMQEVSRYEAFNMQSNVHLLSMDTVKKRQTKKRTNHQLEPDMHVMINEEGKKELLIDSDDGIIETAAHHAVIQRPKRPSKRQQRRQEKRDGAAAQRKTRLD